MKNTRIVKAILIISGLILMIIGTATLFAPVAFLGTTGIDLGGQINLLSEIRAPGAALLASGLIILLGAFVTRLTSTSAVISTLLFLSYSIGRILSIVIDGQPAQSIMGATVIEMILGLAGLFVLMSHRQVNQYDSRQTTNSNKNVRSFNA